MPPDTLTCQPFHQSCFWQMWSERLIRMEPVSGPISDRLRQQFTPDDDRWKYERRGEPVRQLKPGIHSQSLGRGPDPQGNDRDGS